MPNNPTAKPACFKARHLPGHLFKAHEVMFAYTGGGARMFYTAIKPTFANMLNCTEKAATDCINQLCELGWLIRRGGGRDPKTGRKLTYQYEVLSHDEFVKRNPFSCPPLKYPVTDEDLAAKPAMTFNEIEASNLLRNRMLPTTDLGTAIDEWGAQLSEGERAAVIASRPRYTDEQIAASRASRPQCTKDGSRPQCANDGTVLSAAPKPSLAERQSRPQCAKEEFDKGSMSLGSLLKTTTTTTTVQKSSEESPQPTDGGSGGGGLEKKPVSNATAIAADELVIVRFREATGERPKKVSRVQRRISKEWDAKVGRQFFAKMISAWIAAAPWTAETESHLSEFIDNLNDYRRQVLDDAWRDAHSEQKNRADDAARNLALQQAGIEKLFYNVVGRGKTKGLQHYDHEDYFYNGDSAANSACTAEERTRLEEIRTRIDAKLAGTEDATFLAGLIPVLKTRTDEWEAKQTSTEDDGLEQNLLPMF